MRFSNISKVRTHLLLLLDAAAKYGDDMKVQSDLVSNHFKRRRLAGQRLGRAGTGAA
jgi:hypothetical protein